MPLANVVVGIEEGDWYTVGENAVAVTLTMPGPRTDDPFGIHPPHTPPNPHFPLALLCKLRYVRRMSEQTPTHTWTSVLAAVPAPTQAEIDLYALDLPPSDLVERGTKIRSEKILTDLVRISGQAAEFWRNASTAQKRHLLGFSFPLLKVVVHSGKNLADMVASRDANTDEREANRAAAIAIADQTYAQGMDERDRLLVALEGVESLIPGLEARILAARAIVTDHDSLANSLLALIRLAQDLLSNPRSRAAMQLIDGGVTNDELVSMESLGQTVKSAGEHASGARIRGTVSQSDLDLQDGTCLAYMERIMRIFNRAHERDASIPRLLPIATRRMFSMGRKAAPEPAPAAPETPEKTG